MKEKILLVEDNEDLVRALQLHLNKQFDSDTAHDGETGLQLALSGEYSLIILDVSLPKRDGLEILKELRKVNPLVPVMMLTSMSEEIDKVVGLDLGADDYVTKPFNVAELLSRINALMRRSKLSSSTKSTVQEAMVFANLTINLGARKISVNGQETDLTPTEFDLLVLLASHAGQAVSREDLLEAVWGYEGGDYSVSVNNIIMRLRKKIEADPANPKFIQTVRGFGYRFAKLEEL